MSRSGYIDDMEDQWAFIRYRGAVNSATRGKRGQAFFRELLAAMDAMPEKRLIADSLVSGGEFCTLGVLGAARGLDLENMDPDDAQTVAAAFNVADCLAREVVFMNDEAWYDDTPEQRFARMRRWVESQITKEPTQ